MIHCIQIKQSKTCSILLVLSLSYVSFIFLRCSGNLWHSNPDIFGIPLFSFSVDTRFYIYSFCFLIYSEHFLHLLSVHQCKADKKSDTSCVWICLYLKPHMQLVVFLWMDFETGNHFSAEYWMYDYCFLQCVS